MSDNSRIEDLRRRIQTDPASIAFAQLAEEYRRAGRYQEAVDACRGGLEIHPDYISARVTLGRALLKTGELDAAQAEFERVLQSVPRNAPAIRGLADIHQRKGAVADALSYYRAALSLSPEDPEIARTIGDLSEALSQVIDARARVRADSTVNVLERWIAAIHVTRAQRSA